MAITDEDLALMALRAWNGVPDDHPFAWPKDFPEGSRAAWLRVVRACTAPYTAANPGRSLTELPSLHQPDRLQGEDASQDKREPRNSPAAPISDERERSLLGLLTAASHYVTSYSENLNNHPQARDGAADLNTKIHIALGRS